MRVLVAEDDPASQRMLRGALAGWGYDLEAVRDGEAAWRALQGEDSPPMALLNWMMPRMDGVDVCRKVRSGATSRHVYIILLTARGGKGDIIDGLGAGANDYVTKPFDVDELRARVQVGERVVGLQLELARRVDQLEAALSQVQAAPRTVAHLLLLQEDPR